MLKWTWRSFLDKHLGLRARLIRKCHGIGIWDLIIIKRGINFEVVIFTLLISLLAWICVDNFVEIFVQIALGIERFYIIDICWLDSSPILLLLVVLRPTSASTMVISSSPIPLLAASTLRWVVFSLFALHCFLICNAISTFILDIAPHLLKCGW